MHAICDAHSIKGHTLKTRQIVSSLALAAALSLGLAGCGMFVPTATLEQYAPSDGIDVTIETVAVRNLMLVSDAEGKEFNVVFTGVNNGDSPALLRLTFVNASGSAEATADFNLEPGLNVFGPKGGETKPTYIELNGPMPGDTVTAFVEVAGLESVERDVPVLDGVLKEYEDLVP